MDGSAYLVTSIEFSTYIQAIEQQQDMHLRSNNSGKGSGKSTKGDGDTVGRATMGREQRLCSVSVEHAVVDLERKGDDTAVGNVFHLRLDLRVRKEEGLTHTVSQMCKVSVYMDASQELTMVIKAPMTMVYLRPRGFQLHMTAPSTGPNMPQTCTSA